jgi:hypothetical protein
MAPSETAKDATGQGDAFLNTEQICRPLTSDNNLTDLQTQHLSRRFSLALPVAAVVAAIYFGSAER